MIATAPNANTLKSADPQADELHPPFASPSSLLSTSSSNGRDASFSLTVFRRYTFRRTQVLKSLLATYFYPLRNRIQHSA